MSGPDYVNLYARDITARKQAEEKIKISNDELSMLFDLSHSLAEADNLDDILNLVNRHAVESVIPLSPELPSWRVKITSCRPRIPSALLTMTLGSVNDAGHLPAVLSTHSGTE